LQSFHTFIKLLKVKQQGFNMVKTDSNIDAKLDTLLERTAATNQHLKDMNGSIKRHEETFKEVFEQKEAIGHQLQERIQKFASAENDEQREQLPGLIAYIQENATIHTITPLIEKDGQLH